LLVLAAAACSVTAAVSVSAAAPPLALVDAHTHLKTENLTPDQDLEDIEIG
jgi:hypothetical protein